MMENKESFPMNQKLTLALALTVGLFVGGILSHYLLPISVFAQSQTPVLISASAQPVALTTTQGTKLGDYYPNQGAIKLSPVVKLRVNKTGQTVTLELSR
jgi:hypothetical protein